MSRSQHRARPQNRARLGALLALTVALAALVMAFIPGSASATGKKHQTTPIVIEADCMDHLNTDVWFTIESWNKAKGQQLGNPTVEVSYRTKSLKGVISDWTPLATGSFTDKNDFWFNGNFKLAHSGIDAIELKATAVAAWSNKSPGGQSVKSGFTKVHNGCETCPEETTTTTKAPTTTTTKAPTTTTTKAPTTTTTQAPTTTTSKAPTTTSTAKPTTTSTAAPTTTSTAKPTTTSTAAPTTTSTAAPTTTSTAAPTTTSTAKPTTTSTAAPTTTTTAAPTTTTTEATAGVTVTQPPTPSSAVQGVVVNQALPRTGANTTMLVVAALALVTAGSLLARAAKA